MPVAEAHVERTSVADLQKKRLSEIYAPCFALVLQLRGAREFGEEPVLRQRIEKLLDRAEKEAKNAGFASDDVDAASFALVAFIDETILSSDWSHKGQWLSRPLQLQRYQRYDAGEYFFERLQHLRHEPIRRAQALEVYYLCMSLGFKGQYMLHEQEKLMLLIEESHHELADMPGMEAERIAPHGRPRDQRAAAARGSIPTWAIIAGVVAIGLLVYLGMFLYATGAARDAAEFISQLPAPTPQ